VSNPSTVQNGAANDLIYGSVLDSIWGLDDNVSLISLVPAKSPRWNQFGLSTRILRPVGLS
jgi:hypothetical protein